MVMGFQEAPIRQCTPEAVQVAIYCLMYGLVARSGVPVIKGVHNDSRELLVRSDDDDDVPAGLHAPEKGPRQLSLSSRPCVSLRAADSSTDAQHCEYSIPCINLGDFSV